MKILTRSLLAFLLPLLVLTGCTTETEISPDQRGDEARVTFRVELPAHAKPVETRATVGTEDENAVNNIYVLAFDKSDKFAYYKQVTSVSDVNTSQNKREKTFTVSLRLSEGSTDTYTFVLLANVAGETVGQISDALSGAKTKAATLASLTYTSATAPGTKIPMASLSTAATEVKASTVFSGIKLVRMVARIDVQTSLANFRIAEVNLYNNNTRGKVYSSKLNASNVATAVDLPGTPALATTPTVVDNSPAYPKQIESKLYSYETATASDPCLVVKLEYSADGSTNWTNYGYYKMRFVKDGSTVDIKRNTRYIFNISNVASTGFPDKDDAYKSEPVGIDTDVIEWEDAELGGIVVSGNYFLAVGPTEFDLWKNASDQLVKVASNLTLQNGIQWTATVFDDVAGTSKTDCSWLTLTNSTGGVVYTDDTKLKSDLNFSVAANDGTAPRTAWIHIKGGNVVFKVRVTQSHEEAPSTVVPAISAKLSDGTSAGTILKTGGTTTINVTSNMTSWSPVLLIDGVAYTGDLSAYFGTHATGSGDATVTFTATALASDATADKVYTITFKDNNGATVSTPAIVLTQKAPVPGEGGGGTPPTDGVLAPEGIIAVDANGVLNTDGPLRPNNYIVYFKWGSLIALAGSATEFSSDQIAWVPEGYDYETLVASVDMISGTTDAARRMRWDLILHDTWTSYNMGLGSAALTKEQSLSNNNGLGNPCEFAAYKNSEGNMRIMYNQEEEYNGTKGYTLVQETSTFGVKYYLYNNMHYWPASGHRHPFNGTLSTCSLSNGSASDLYGGYWAFYNQGAYRYPIACWTGRPGWSYPLYWPETMDPNATVYYPFNQFSNGFAIRCVPK